MESLVQEKLAEFEQEIKRALKDEHWYWYIDNQEHLNNCMFCFNIRHKSDNNFSGKICLHESGDKFDFIGKLNDNFDATHFFTFSKRFPDDLVYLPLFIKQNMAAKKYFEFFKPAPNKESNKYQFSDAFNFSITDNTILGSAEYENKKMADVVAGSLNNFVNSNGFSSFIENIVHSFMYEENNKDFASFFFSKMINNLPNYTIERRKLGFLYERSRLNFNYMSGGVYFQSFDVNIDKSLEEFISFMDKFLKFIKEDSKSNIIFSIKVLDELSWLSFDNMFLQKLENIFIDKSLLYYNIDYYNREISFDAKNYIVLSKVMALLFQGFIYSYKIAKIIHKEDVSMCCLVKSNRNISFFLPVINPKERLDGAYSYLSYIQISMARYEYWG